MFGYGRLIRGNRNLRLLWSAQFISELGDWFNNIAVLGLALHLTGSAAVISAVWISRFAAVVLTGPISGVIVDRIDRKRILILSDLVRAVMAAGYLLVTASDRMWLAYALGALMMGVSSFFTPARSATIPNIMPHSDLTAGNALISSTSALAIMVGSALGAVIVSNFGYGVGFILNALSFAVSAILIYFIKVPPAKQNFKPPDHTPYLEAFKIGMRYIKGSPLVKWIMFLGIGWATCGGAAQVLFAIMPVQVFGTGDAGVGWLYAAAGMGIMAGAFLVNIYMKNIGFAVARWVVGVCFILYGMFYSLFSLAPTFVPAAAMIFLSRTAAGVCMVLNTTFLMKAVANEVRGRVFSVIDSMVTVTMMVSILSVGILAGHSDPRAIGVVVGSLPALLGLAWLGLAAGEILKDEAK